MPGPVWTLIAFAAASAAVGHTAHPSDPIAGRTPGQPQQCIDKFRSSGNYFYPDGRILFRNERITPDYISRAQPGCAKGAINRTIIPLGTAHRGELCRGDTIRVTDTVTDTVDGSCTLGDFVPYPKPGH